jgi:hypothetical protein
VLARRALSANACSRYAFPVSRPWYTCCGRRVWYGDVDRWRYVPYWELPFYRYRWIPQIYVEAQKPCAFSISVEVETASDVTRLECPSHEIKYEFPDAASKRNAVGALFTRRRACVTTVCSIVVDGYRATRQGLCAACAPAKGSRTGTCC